ncbi:MAG TPA: TetR/AcrR family transcriptional regulator [Verrucomicrobiae bacterium]|nr:TetR/AcrR family transcriptional regulator [Verrucomicrobiae bacterium]
MNGGSVHELSFSSRPRRERERLQRRADILRAAEAVFAAHGFHAASIEQIAGTAEYGTGTVYLYFRDKEALYLELFEEKIRELSDLIRQRTKQIKDPGEAILQLVTARMEFFERNRAFFRIYAREGLNREEAGQERWAGVMGLYADYLRLLAGLIGAGQRRGLFRKGDPHHLAVALSGMMIQLTRDQLQSHGERPLTDLTPMILDLFLHGVMAGPKGGGKSAGRRPH